MFKKTVVWLFIVGSIFVFGLLLGLVFARAGLLNFSRRMDSSVLLQRVQTLSQLVTVKYVLEKVVVLDDVKWYGDNRVILVAHGVVKAGIDLQGLKPGEISVDNKRIKMTLPRPSITDVYLDDRRTEVLERATGVMRVFDKDLEQNARRQAVDDLRLAARENGILKDADERARAQLTNLFHQLGFTEVELTSK